MANLRIEYPVEQIHELRQYWFDNDHVTMAHIAGAMGAVRYHYNLFQGFVLEFEDENLAVELKLRGFCFEGIPEMVERYMANGGKGVAPIVSR